MKLIDKENYESSSYIRGMMMEIYYEMNDFFKHINLEKYESGYEVFKQMLLNKNYVWEVSKICYKYDTEKNKIQAWSYFLEDENIAAIGLLYELEVDYKDEAKDVSDILFRRSFPTFLCKYYSEQVYKLSKEVFDENWDYDTEIELGKKDLDDMNREYFGDRV